MTDYFLGKTDKMKKRIISLILCAVFVCGAFIPQGAAWADTAGPEITAQAAIIYCADTGEVIWGEKCRPADGARQHDKAFDLSPLRWKTLTWTMWSRYQKKQLR